MNPQFKGLLRTDLPARDNSGLLQCCCWGLRWPSGSHLRKLNDHHSGQFALNKTVLASFQTRPCVSASLFSCPTWHRKSLSCHHLGTSDAEFIKGSGWGNGCFMTHPFACSLPMLQRIWSPIPDSGYRKCWQLTLQIDTPLMSNVSFLWKERKFSVDSFNLSDPCGSSGRTLLLFLSMEPLSESLPTLSILWR